MNSSVDNNPPKLKATNKQKRKRALTLVIILFILLGVAYFIYWLLVSRHFQETDDAYVVGNQVQIMSQVSGSVERIWPDNTDYVRRGDILVSLDKTDAEQAFEEAQNALAGSVRETRQLMINSQQHLATIALRKTALAEAEADLKRRQPLSQASLIGREELQHAVNKVASAKSELDVAIQQYNANQAILLDTSIEEQPVIKQNAAKLRDAWLKLKRTDIRSPIDGYVSRRNVQLGAQISPATPLMAVVPAHELWVDANFKETQLSGIRIGQSATVITDVYGDSVKYKGKVTGLDMGTGSAFSLLPAQNATGNWIKVVQRLPVRIELDAEQVTRHPLRIGLSTMVTIDTRQNQDGPVLASVPRHTPAYNTQALMLDMKPVNQLIADIIRINSGQ